MNLFAIIPIYSLVFERLVLKDHVINLKIINSRFFINYFQIIDNLLIYLVPTCTAIFSNIASFSTSITGSIITLLIISLIIIILLIIINYIIRTVSGNMSFSVTLVASCF